jgi:ArsR family transcriptional regulator
MDSLRPPCYICQREYMSRRPDVPFAALDHALRALADPTRLRILGLLMDGEVCVCHIYEALRIPQPKASRHLAYLRKSGLVETRKDGLWVYYRLAEGDTAGVKQVVDAALRALERMTTIDADRARRRARLGCC